ITETQWYLLTADITREIDFEITLISYLFRKCNGPRADHLTGHYPSPEARIEFYAGFIHRLELHGL
ncbi:hypothetical protein, partial [Klebsiella pneumoniae]|uniref:hypothetical protein n=1 Tax=Klebsiella pneumoniae TaxID=573 RepID=UPI003B986EE7